MKTAVEMNNITVKFDKVIANNNISFKAFWGEVHGLVGENGAGKTTLMSVLYGMLEPNEGEIKINEKLVSFHSSKQAIKQGIGMVHQHFSLVPSMTVTENIIMGNPPMKRGLIDGKRAKLIVKELCEEHGLQINPDTKIKDLTVGLQQRVEILKALYLGAEILIMDEPTAVLVPQEIDQLMQTLEKLKKKGKCIILITHKLAEVKMVTDRITVLRNGLVTANVETKDTDERQIAKMMVGREVLLRIDKKKSNPKEIVLEAKNISCMDKMGLPAVNGISITVRSGEVVGIAGVQGNGQSELADAITGLLPVTSGTVNINGTLMKGSNLPLKCRNVGLSHIHEDRLEVGSSVEMSIRDNFLAPIHQRGEFKKGLIFNYKEADRVTKEAIDKFGVKVNKITDEMGSLSGGNMQKLIISREFYADPKLLIANQPTRGVDIGATEFIYHQIIEARDLGSGVLLISNELSEILTLSDRILVIFKGKIIGELNRSEATEESLGLLMAGITEGRPNGI